jgi:pimeloyl-ACP methyl ester carboxylesterase
VVSSIPGPVNLLGHSYGALLSLEAALRVTNLNRLVLYEPSIWIGGPIYPPEVKARIQAQLDSGDREGALITFFGEIAGMSEQELAIMRSEPVWQARMAAAHTIIRELVDEEYVLEPERFKDLKVPTLLLSGSESPEFLRRATEMVHIALPNSRIVVLQGQHHIAMRTAPEMFVRAVTEFLLGGETAGSGTATG